MLAFAENSAITKYPIGLGDLTERFPDTSFAVPLHAPDLEEFDVVEVIERPAPQIDRRTQRVLEAEPVLIEGAWTQQWEVQALSPGEQQQLTNGQAAAVRAERNKRLADCDWTQLPDAPVNAAVWASYRQALRDITNQPSFPWDTIWPEQPA